MIIMHTADSHFDRSNIENTGPAFEFLVDEVRRRRPSLFVHAGDLFHSRGMLDPPIVSGARAMFWQISRVCPVVIIPGNHDINYAWKEPDNVFATLSFMMADYKIAALCSPQAAVVRTSDGENVGLAAIPFPNKYLYLASRDEEQARVKAQQDASLIDDDRLDMGLLMGRVVSGLKTRLDKVAPGLPHLAVFHGTVVGGKGDDESALEPGDDIQVPLDVFHDFDAVMAGHLHRAQEVGGRVVYSGSLSPFTHAQDGYKPSYCLWDLQPKHPSTNGGTFEVGFQRVQIPVACPRVTVDFDARTKPTVTPTQHALDALSMHTLSDCHVRLRGTILAHQKGDWQAPTVVTELQRRGAKTWKFDIQTTASVRLETKDIRSDDSINELVRRWTAVQPEEWPELEPLQEFATSLEIGIQDRLKRLSPVVGYKTLAVTGTNWKQHRYMDLSVKDLPRLVCIWGAMASGKSNAARLESFVLYGMDALNPGCKLADVVRHGGEKMTGTVRLETLDGQRYKVTRTVKIQKSGRAVSDLVLMKLDGQLPKAMVTPEDPPSYSVKDFEDVDNWVPLNLANARETQHEIHRLAGHPDLYFRTRFARQGKIDAILEASPKEINTTIQEALNLASFDVRRDAAKEKVKTLKQNADSLQFALKSLDDQLAEKPAVVKQNKSLADLLEQKEAAVVATLDQRDDRQRRLQKTEETAVRLGGLEMERGKWRTDLRVLKDDRQSTLGDMQAFRDKVAKLDRQEVLADLVARDTAKDALADWTNKRDRVRGLGSQLEARQTAQKDEQRHGERDLQMAKDALAKAEKAAELLGDVPCQHVNVEDKLQAGIEGMEITKLVVEQTKGCQFLKGAIRDRDRIPALQTAVDDIDDRNAKATQLGVDAVRALELECKAVGYDTAKHAAATATYTALVKADLDNQLRALDDVQARTTELQKLVDNHNKTIKRTLGYLDGVPSDLDDQLAANVDLLHQDKLALAGGQMALNQAAEAKDSTVRLRGQLEGRLAHLEKAEQQAQNHRANLEACCGELRLAAAYHAAVDRDGIPFLLLEQAIPSLQNFVNDLLGDTNLTIEIDPARDLVSGKVKDEVSIMFRDPNGLHVLAEASGGQRYLLGVPLRAAIANLEAERSGVQPQNFWIDEGFGSLDAENIQHARAMLEKLAARFERVIFITHIPAMAKSADATIEVLPGADGSLLELTTT